MMTDFIVQTKLPGVLIAKAMISKTNFDLLLKHDEELKQRLTDIGYTVKLSEGTKSELTKELNEELKSAREIIDKTSRKAEIFSTILTETLKHLAEKSPHDTEIIYHLSQILFIWDEFIDFEDYQKSGGDVSKIRESVFYKAATAEMQEMNTEEDKQLENLEVKTYLFEDALKKLQQINSENRFTPDRAYLIVETLKHTGLVNVEIVFFLLVLESALFIDVAENLLSNVAKDQLSFLNTVSDIKSTITMIQDVLNLTTDGLENLLEKEAQILVLKLDKTIFV